MQTQIDSKIGSAAAINPTIVDAKGDIIAATAADTVARLAVGANNTVLTADSATATGIKWATPAGGLTLISATPVSGANAVNIDGCFTSTYTNYRVIYSGTTNTNSGGYDWVYLQYRTSGTTNANGSYDGYVTRFNSASSTTQLNAYQNATIGHELNQAGNGMCNVLDIFSPQATEYTSLATNGIIGQITGGYNRAIQTHGYGFFKNTTSFDGIRINSGAALMTGTVFVYGYQKS